MKQLIKNKNKINEKNRKNQKKKEKNRIKQKNEIKIQPCYNGFFKKKKLNRKIKFFILENLKIKNNKF